MKVDYNRPITRLELDKSIVKAKFQYIDMLKRIKEVTEKDYLKIFNDVTMFSYYLFKFDGKPLKLYSYQDAILNDKHRRLFFRASNQIGKSLALDADAAYNLVIDHGKNYTLALVSKSLPQASERMRRIKSLLNTANFSWKEARGMSDNMSVITIDITDPKEKDELGNEKVMYTNTLICAPCTEGLLGYACDKLYLDEFEFWEVDQGYFYNQIADPRTYTTKGQIIIFSNPNGQDSFGADLEKLQKKDGSKLYHVYNFNYLDCPGNTEEGLEEAKIGKTRAQIESTLLSIRSLSDRNYFTPEEIEESYDKDLTELKMIGKQPFFFLDVGAIHDQSVLVGGYVDLGDDLPYYTFGNVKGDDDYHKFIHIHIPIIHVYPVGYPISMVVGAKGDDDVEQNWHYEKSVREYLEEWAVDGVVPLFGVDVTGNSGISPLFDSIGIYPDDITFSGPVKSGMYQRFKYFMEKGLIHRIKSREWDHQARHLQMKKSVRGYLMLHHETESDLDDCMDATAGLIHLASPYTEVQPSVKFF